MLNRSSDPIRATLKETVGQRLTHRLPAAHVLPTPWDQATPTASQRAWCVPGTLHTRTSPQHAGQHRLTQQLDTWAQLSEEIFLEGAHPKKALKQVANGWLGAATQACFRLPGETAGIRWITQPSPREVR